MAPRALLVAWDYPHPDHATGSAVARRVRQIARGFAAHGWSVDVVIRDHCASPSRAVVRRLAERFGTETVQIHCVPGPDGKPAERYAPLRMLASAWYALVMGDRSGRWGHIAIDYLRRGGVSRPDVIIGFYTPRGPLLTAARAGRFWNVPWIADFQDEWSQGSSHASLPLVRHWMRRVVESADRVVQVSPEWAEMDRRALRRSVDVVRHAVPAQREAMHVAKQRAHGEPLTLLYSGSLNTREQDPRPLLHALRDLAFSRPDTAVRLAVACTESAFDTWKREAHQVGAAKHLRWLGWLSAAQLECATREADALVLIPLATRARPGVPSKLFAYLATERPVLLAGPDSGGLASLFSEWKAPKVLCADAATIRKAVERLMSGDCSLCLQRSALGSSPLEEGALGATYVRWASNLTRVTMSEVPQGAAPATAQ